MTKPLTRLMSPHLIYRAVLLWLLLGQNKNLVLNLMATVRDKILVKNFIKILTMASN